MNLIYTVTIYPIEWLYEKIYLLVYSGVGSYGFSLAILSLISFILCWPLAKFAKKFQQQESNIQSVLAPQINEIKAEYKGAARQQQLTSLYKQYSYHPIYALRSSAGLLVQVPFLIAAFYMLSNLELLQGQSFLIIKDLSRPDALLGGLNLLPLLMTLINLASVYFYTQQASSQDKIQLYAISFFFLIILYNAISALVFYWTCNNIFSLIKNIITAKYSPSSLKS